MAAVLGGGLMRREPVGSRAIDEIGRNQREAERQRAIGKRLVKKAADDLVGSGSSHIVLGHIHPRWLRREVERRMDAGEPITAERVEQLRALGAGRA